MTTDTRWALCAAGQLDARNALLTENLSLVHHVARQLVRRLAASADLDEMVSAGTLGLMSALDSFDSTRGLAFSTYAVARIRGAILDELRRQDHVPRSVRRKTRDMSGARQALTHELGRAPRDGEVAERLDVDLRTMWRWEADVDGAVHVPMDRQPSNGDATSFSPADYLASGGENAEERMTRADELTALRDAIAGLRAQERTVLSLCYFEELRLTEIGEMLGLTDSRVSQIRTRALRRLREAMAPSGAMV